MRCGLETLPEGGQCAGDVSHGMRQLIGWLSAMTLGQARTLPRDGAPVWARVLLLLVVVWVTSWCDIIVTTRCRFVLMTGWRHHCLTVAAGSSPAFPVYILALISLLVLYPGVEGSTIPDSIQPVGWISPCPCLIKTVLNKRLFNVVWCTGSFLLLTVNLSISRYLFHLSLTNNQ